MSLFLIISIAGVIWFCIVAYSRYQATEGGKFPRIRDFTNQFVDRWLAPGIGNGTIADPKAAKSALYRTLEVQLSQEIAEQAAGFPRQERAASLMRRSDEHKRLWTQALLDGDQRLADENKLLESFLAARAISLDPEGVRAD